MPSPASTAQPEGLPSKRASVGRIMAGLVPVTLLTQVLSFGSSLALANAPDAMRGCFRVPRILDGARE